MAAKQQVIAILFAVFLIMLCISVKAKNNSAIAKKKSIALHNNRIQGYRNESTTNFNLN